MLLRSIVHLNTFLQFNFSLLLINRIFDFWMIFYYYFRSNQSRVDIQHNLCDVFPLRDHNRINNLKWRRKLAESKIRTNIIYIDWNLGTVGFGCEIGWFDDRIHQNSYAPFSVKVYGETVFVWILWYGLGIDTCELSNVNIATRGTESEEMLFQSKREILHLQHCEHKSNDLLTNWLVWLEKGISYPNAQ